MQQATLSKPVEDFPNYEVYEDGSIYSKSLERWIRPSRTTRGHMKVTLYREGFPYTRSLPLLVAKAHVYNPFDPEIFDTPVHLDCDHTNNHAENLVWRPRWFAVRYHAQYWKANYRFSTGVVRETRSGETLGMFEACQKYGLLFVDVLQSTFDGSEVFPTRKSFVSC